MSEDKRQHIRTPIALSLRVTFEDNSTMSVETWDISDGGIGIKSPEENKSKFHVGTKVKSKVIGLPFDSPELDMVVVRVDGDKIGLQNL